jgi:hypothetical protein
MSEPQTMTLRFTDQSKQRTYLARDIPRDALLGEIRESVVAAMNLPRNTPQGEVDYKCRLDREGRHLHDSEVVGEAAADQDLIQLQPEAIAGLPG